MVSYTNSSSSHSHVSHHQEPINQHLHSVQKPPSKPSKKSSSAQPSASAQPRVYNVKPIHFRELVQRLTGASQPQPQPQRIHSAAPPPIQLANRPNMIVKSDHLAVMGMPGDVMGSKYQKKPSSSYADAFNLGDGTELSLSPSSCSWFSFPLLSPGPVSNFGA